MALHCHAERRDLGMSNHHRPRKTSVLTMAISLVVLLGGEACCLADNGRIKAKLNPPPNNDVGVAFPPSMGPDRLPPDQDPKYTPMGNYFKVFVDLLAPDGYSLTTSGGTLAGDGSTIWTCKGPLDSSGNALAVSGTTPQTWEGKGVRREDSWSDMLFPAQLAATRRGWRRGRRWSGRLLLGLQSPMSASTLMQWGCTATR